MPGTLPAGLRGIDCVSPGSGLEILSDSVVTDSGQIPAARPPVAGDASHAVHTVERDFFTNIPARGIDPAILIQPGVISQGTNPFGEPIISVRGGREGEIGYRLEGVPVNDVIRGGRAVSVTAEAVERVQVSAGGPAAEFGGANAGLVQVDLRTGRPDRWGMSLIAETDRYTGMNARALGGYSYGYSDWTGTAGGPFPGLGNVLRLFASVQNTFYRDPTVSVRSGYNFSGANAVVTQPLITPYHSTPRPDTVNIVVPGGNALGGGDNRWIMTGTALIDLSPVQVRIAGSYSHESGRTAADFQNLLNQSRLPLNIENDGFVDARVTHVLSPLLSYQASFSYTGNSFVTEDPQLLDNLFAYGDPAANAALGYPLMLVGGGAYNWPWYQLWNFAFGVNQPGRQIAGYEKTSQRSFGGRAGLNLYLGNHDIAIGGEYTRYITREFAPLYVFAWSDLRRTVTNPASLEILLAQYSGSGNWGYDLYGHEIGGDDIRDGEVYSLGPRRPVIWGAYIEDRMEISGIVLNLGLRYDDFNADSRDPVNPGDPLLSIHGLMLASQIIQSGKASQLSPRIGVTVPLSERSLVYARFGRYIQQRNLQGWNLNTARITQFDAGFSSQLTDLVSFDGSAFVKEISHQLSTVRHQSLSTPTGYPTSYTNGEATTPYGFFSSGDDVTPMGVEVRLILHRLSRLAAQINYTVQNIDPRWLSSLNSTIETGNRSFVPQYEFGADFNSVHRGSVLVDYRFGNDDGGPILEQAGLNLLLTFNSGHNVTRFEPAMYSTTPWFVQLDGRLDKSFTIGPLLVNVYLYAINLLGRDNAVNVFPRTGDSANDGWFATSTGQSEARAYGPQYVAFYYAVVNGKNSGNWGPPRQIRFGVRLDY